MTEREQARHDWLAANKKADELGSAYIASLKHASLKYDQMRALDDAYFKRGNNDTE